MFANPVPSIPKISDVYPISLVVLLHPITPFKIIITPKKAKLRKRKVSNIFIGHLSVIDLATFVKKWPDRVKRYYLSIKSLIVSKSA